MSCYVCDGPVTGARECSCELCLRGMECELLCEDCYQGQEQPDQREP